MKNKNGMKNKTRFVDSGDMEDTKLVSAIFQDCDSDCKPDFEQKFKDSQVLEGFSLELKNMEQKPGKSYLPEKNIELDIINEIEPDSVDLFDFPEDDKARKEMLMNFLAQAESEALKQNNMRIARLCTKAIRKVFPWH